MRKLLSQIVAATIGLWLSALYVPAVIIRTYPTSHFFGFPLTQQWEVLLVLGIVLGLLNYFLKPLLKTLSLPLEIITLGFFSIIINMGLIWLLDTMFDEIYTPWFFPLFYTTLIIWVSNTIINIFLAKK